MTDQLSHIFFALQHASAPVIPQQPSHSSVRASLSLPALGVSSLLLLFMNCSSSFYLTAPLNCHKTTLLAHAPLFPRLLPFSTASVTSASHLSLLPHFVSWTSATVPPLSALFVKSKTPTTGVRDAAAATAPPPATNATVQTARKLSTEST